jgi:hypothetical protein
MRIELLALLLAAGACQQTLSSPAPAQQAPASFNVEALLADASGYAAQRYSSSAMPDALVSDLEAAGFECQSRATISECTHTRPAGGVCFDVTGVRIDRSGAISAERNRRCLGAQPPRQP